MISVVSVVDRLFAAINENPLRVEKHVGLGTAAKRVEAVCVLPNRANTQYEEEPCESLL